VSHRGFRLKASVPTHAVAVPTGECVLKGLPFSNNMTRRHFEIDLGQDYEENWRWKFEEFENDA